MPLARGISGRRGAGCLGLEARPGAGAGECLGLEAFQEGRSRECLWPEAFPGGGERSAWSQRRSLAEKAECLGLEAFQGRQEPRTPLARGIFKRRGAECLEKQQGKPETIDQQPQRERAIGRALPFVSWELAQTSGS